MTFDILSIVSAAVLQQQRLEEPELADGKVRVVHGLPPFLAANPHADVGLLDHADVVRRRRRWLA